MTSSQSATAPLVWFITGASSGIGLAFARAALERGDSVAGLSRTTEGLRDLSERHQDRLVVLADDVADEPAVRGAVAQTLEAFGRVDVVLNNAGVGLFGGLEEGTDAQWREVFETNVFGALNVLRATVPLLREQRSGWILQTSAHFGQAGRAGVSAIAASKHAMEGWADCLALELEPFGVQVLTFEPGFTASAFVSRLAMGENPHPDFDQTVRANLQRLANLPPAVIVDPARLVAAVLRVMNEEKPPRRLTIGSFSHDMIKDSLASRLADVEAWAELSRGVDVAG